MGDSVPGVVSGVCCGRAVKSLLRWTDVASYRIAECEVCGAESYSKGTVRTISTDDLISMLDVRAGRRSD